MTTQMTLGFVSDLTDPDTTITKIGILTIDGCNASVDWLVDPGDVDPHPLFQTFLQDLPGWIADELAIRRGLEDDVAFVRHLVRHTNVCVINETTPT